MIASRNVVVFGLNRLQEGRIGNRLLPFLLIFYDETNTYHVPSCFVDDVDVDVDVDDDDEKQNGLSLFVMSHLVQSR
jgi:hypothetical protein